MLHKVSGLFIFAVVTVDVRLKRNSEQSMLCFNRPQYSRNILRKEMLILTTVCKSVRLKETEAEVNMLVLGFLSISESEGVRINTAHSFHFVLPSFMYIMMYAENEKLL